MSYGKIDFRDVQVPIQQTIKEKAMTTSNYEMFEQTVAKLQVRGLLDNKRLPTHHSVEVTPLETLRNSVLSAHRRIAELEESLKKNETEVSRFRGQVYELERELKDARTSMETMMPPTEITSKESLPRGAEYFVGKEIVNKLSPVAKSGLRDAVRCILCGISTPAAMVSLRSSEDAVRKYYEFKTNQKAGSLMTPVIEKRR